MIDVSKVECSFPQKDGRLKTVKLLDVITSKDIWNVGKATIIGLTGIQKLMTYGDIVEKNFATHITPTKDNRQQHGVNVWIGLKGDKDPDNWKRASGEASSLNTGEIITKEDGSKTYVEHTKIDSKYRYAMADKRALCRAVLKFVQLYGVYSEIEAVEFARTIDGDDIEY